MLQNHASRSGAAVAMSSSASCARSSPTPRTARTTSRRYGGAAMYCASRARTRRGFPPDRFHARRGWKVTEVEPPSADKGVGSSTAATIATTQTLLPSIAGDTDAYMWGDHSSLKYPCNDGLTEETSNARSTPQSCASESFASINGLWGKLGASGRCCQGGPNPTRFITVCIGLR
jgi:hypothetical protein